MVLLSEIALAAIGALVAFYYPRLGSEWFRAAERRLAGLARRRKTSVLVVGLLAVAARVAVLPVLPVPQPFSPDEFGHLFVADTLLRGRLANPTHPMWIHFETFYILQKPTYSSMFPPAQGIILGIGKLIGGSAFVGVCLALAVMCGAICWTLQGWLPPGWALLGGALAVIRFAFFNEWSNTYFGAAVPAVGGALVLGALPRIKHHPCIRNATIMGFGLAVLANSRPYEGFVLSLPVAVSLLAWVVSRKAPPLAVVLRSVILPLAALLAVTAVAMGYYFWRITGNPFRMPYQVNEDTYMAGRYFPWEASRPEPVYHHKLMQDTYARGERRYRAMRSPSGWAASSLAKMVVLWMFLLGPILSIPLVMFPRIIRDRRVRFLLIAGGAFLCGLLMEVFLLLHYVAPVVCLVFAIVLQGMRHLRVWRWNNAPTGLSLCRFIPLACTAAVILSFFGIVLHVHVPFVWSIPDSEVVAGTERAQIFAELKRLAGKELVIVRYKPGHDPNVEWIYNKPDIDAAKIVCAQDMGAAKNEELIRYFKDRRVWLVEPDTTPPKLSPYPDATLGQLQRENAPH